MCTAARGSNQVLTMNINLWLSCAMTQPEAGLMNESPMQRAVRAAEAIANDGTAGTVLIARKCGVSLQAVHKWLRVGAPPPTRCLDIEQLTHPQVSRYDLRPDVYGPDPLCDGIAKRAAIGA